MSTRLRGWSRGRVSRRHLTAAGTALVLVVGAVVLWRTVDVDTVRRSLVAADPALLSLAVLVYSLSWPIRGRRYGTILAGMDRRCGAWFLTGTVFLSQTANLAVPARAGDGVRAYLLRRSRGVPYATGAASLAVERLVDVVVLAALGGAALLWLVLTGSVTPPGGAETAAPVALAVGAAGVVLLASTAHAVRVDRGPAHALTARLEGSRLAPVADFLVRVGRAVREVATTPRALTAVGLWSALVWGLDVLTAVVVLAALGGGGAGPSIAALFAVATLAVSAGNLATVLPVSHGGIGVYEAAFAGIVVAVTPVPLGIAVTAAILDHLLKNAVTVLGGGVAAVLLEVSPRVDAIDTPEPEPPGF